MRKIAGAIYLFYSLSVFFAVMFLLLPFFLLFSLLPSKISYPLLFSCIRLWSWITMIFVFIKINIRKNPNWDKNKSSIENYINCCSLKRMYKNNNTIELIYDGNESILEQQIIEHF